jgi:hypothetical protein
MNKVRVASKQTQTPDVGNLLQNGWAVDESMMAGEIPKHYEKHDGVCSSRRFHK